MKFSVHTVVKNEDQWIWYAINSVLPYAEKIYIYDTGSSDKTVEIIKSISSDKISFEEKGEVDKKGLTKLRLNQLRKTKTDWLLILDGDEIWPEKEFKKLINVADKAPKEIVALFNKTRNCIGDVFHYLPDNMGNYKIGEKKGNLNMRLIRKTDDLTIKGEYPLEFYTNQKGPLQLQTDNLKFVDCWYLHTTYLKRSSFDSNKTSGSLGKKKIWIKGLKMSSSKLPNVFFQEKLEIVPDPLKKRNLFYEVLAGALNPILNLRRKIV